MEDIYLQNAQEIEAELFKAKITYSTVLCFFIAQLRFRGFHPHRMFKQPKMGEFTKDSCIC